FLRIRNSPNAWEGRRRDGPRRTTQRPSGSGQSEPRRTQCTDSEGSMGACPARREMPADATGEELGSSVPSAPRMVGAEGILESRCHTTPLRPLAFLRIRTPLDARVGFGA